MKRRNLIIALILIGIVVVGAAVGIEMSLTNSGAPNSSASSVWQHTLYVESSDTPTTLDPAWSSRGPPDNRLTKEIYDTLLQYPLPGSTDYRPDLATSWNVSSDGLTVTFNLRQGVRFDSGDYFNADCVVYNFNRIAYGPDGSILTDFAKNWTAVGTYTLEVTLMSPSIEWIDTFPVHPFCGIVDPNFCEEHGGMNVSKTGAPLDYLTTHADGTGPYMCGDWGGEWVKGSYITYVANPYYWGGSITNITKIVKTFVYEPETAMMLLAKGSEDVGYVSQDLLPDVQTGISSGALPLYIPGVGVAQRSLVGRFDMNTQRQPFDNLDFRLALQFAFDHQAYISNVTYGFGIDYWVFSGLGTAYYLVDGPKFEYNLTLAKQYLAEFYATANSTEIAAANKGFTIYTTTDTIDADTGIFAKNCFTQLGLNVNVVSEVDSTSHGRGSSGNYDMIVSFWGLMGADPYLDIEWTETTAYYPQVIGWMGNCEYFGNATTDALINQTGTETNFAERNATFAAIDVAEHDFAGQIYLCQYSGAMDEENVYQTYVHFNANSNLSSILLPYYEEYYLDMYKVPSKTATSSIPSASLVYALSLAFSPLLIGIFVINPTQTLPNSVETVRSRKDK